MLTKALLLYFLGLLSYYCVEVEKNFQGASQNAKFYLAVGGFIGGWAYYALVVWGFFVMKWYIPIIVIVASLLSSSLIFFLDSILLRMIAPALCIILTITLVILFL